MKDPTSTRSPRWIPAWRSFVDELGGPALAADVIGVHYLTVKRWGMGEGDPPEAMRRLVRMVAVSRGLRSPV